MINNLKKVSNRGVLSSRFSPELIKTALIFLVDFLNSVLKTTELKRCSLLVIMTNTFDFLISEMKLVGLSLASFVCDLFNIFFCILSTAGFKTTVKVGNFNFNNITNE